MLAVKDRPNYDTRTAQHVGNVLQATWVDIDEPDPTAAADPLTVYRQGWSHGAATFGRLEGAWYGNGSIYIVSTSGGDAGEGSVFRRYRHRDHPRGANRTPTGRLGANSANCVSERTSRLSPVHSSLACRGSAMTMSNYIRPAFGEDASRPSRCRSCRPGTAVTSKRSARTVSTRCMGVGDYHVALGGCAVSPFAEGVIEKVRALAAPDG